MPSGRVEQLSDTLGHAFVAVHRHLGAGLQPVLFEKEWEGAREMVQ